MIETDTVNFIFDGCPTSALHADLGAQITFKFDRRFQASKIAILSRKTFICGNMDDYRSTYRLSSSNDGQHFGELAEFTINGLNEISSFSFKQTTASFF
ncbi:hypothetical protein [Sunxiuqinia indica]|uniref:hypothetical protein n=1 Tax=Sunxiuqinia indica TaxID=2692584 RepID=UPI001358C7CD|nr:hypothetical protein [Sunxiuqinia indica]